MQTMSTNSAISSQRRRRSTVPLTVLTHPIAQHYLSVLRATGTTPETYRLLTRTLANMLALEATRQLPVVPVEVHGPLETSIGAAIGQRVVVVPILRAGLAMADAVADAVPGSVVGHIGLARDEATAVAAAYYRKLPSLADSHVLVVDPMLATGGSAEMAIRDVMASGPAVISLLSVVSTPEAIGRLSAAFPELNVFTVAVDRGLNDRKYILPGLGDYGDRLYGTSADQS